MPYEGPLSGLGAALKTLRVRTGMKQREVADALKTTQSSVSDWENEKNLETVTLDRLLTLYESTLLELGEILEQQEPGTGAGSGSGGGGGRTIHPEDIRREIGAALDRLGVPHGKIDEDSEEDRDLGGGEARPGIVL